MCSASVCNVKGCSRSVCGMLVCTVNFVCTLTQEHGSCTSSLQWLCLLLCCQPRRREVRNPREAHQSNKRALILCSVSVFSSSPRLLFILLVSSWSISRCYCRIQALLSSFASLRSSPLLLACTVLFFPPAVNFSHLK